MFGDFLINSGGGQPQPTSAPVAEKTPDAGILRRGTVRPAVAYSTPELFPPSKADSTPLGTTSKKLKRTTFVEQPALDAIAITEQLRPGQEALTGGSALVSGGSFVQTTALPGKSAKYKARMHTLQESSFSLFSSNAPPITISKGSNEFVKTLLSPILHLPNDPLVDAQVAWLDISMRERMKDIEALLHKPMNEKPTKADFTAVKFRKNLEGLRSKASPVHMPSFLSSPSRHLTEGASPTRFVTSVGKYVDETEAKKRLSGPMIMQQRQEQREAQRELERLDKDVELRRHQRSLAALEQLQAKAHLYADMIAEQEEKQRNAERGGTGNQRTTTELVAEWRKAIKDTEFTDQMLDQREKDRAARKLDKVGRHRLRVAAALLNGLVVATDEGAPVPQDGQKRWRVTKIGSVDAFSVPRWSSRPVFTYPGDSVIVEEESIKVGHVQWIRSIGGWVPVHVVCGGFSKTQLFAESTVQRLDGETMSMAMLNIFDESCESVDKAYQNCTPDALKSMDEMKDMLFQQEFSRAMTRELPAGHHDAIKQVWEEMQRQSKHHRREMRDKLRATTGEGSGLNDENSDDETGG